MEIQCRNPDCGEIAVADIDCLYIMKYCYRCGRRYMNMQELAQTHQAREQSIDRREQLFFVISLLLIIISGGSLLYAVYQYKLYESEVHRWWLAGWLVMLGISELLIWQYIKKKRP